tara:strand:- start:2035 stop:2379 length:345 start_codon:yes stop_codon:yes gene_type:complete
MENNTHEGIANSKHKGATEAQVKYLVYLYQDTIKKNILKKHDKLKKDNDFVNFKGKSGRFGKFQVHLWNSFIPESKMTSQDISKLINDAKVNNKFDTAFTKKLVQSVNDYVKSA